MYLYFSTEEFQLKGQPYKDFPLLYDHSLSLVKPAFYFLVYHCMTRGRVQSTHSWARYGQDMYDYFSWLEANNIEWTDTAEYSGQSIVALYRDWSLEHCKLSETTINQRLRTIVMFYRYAYRQGWVDTVPFNIETVMISRQPGLLAHVDASSGTKQALDILLKEKRKPLKVLSKAQAIELLNAIENPTHKLMARMGLQVGLRREEINTFPRKYVINPMSGKRRSGMFRVTLDPKDMHTKGSKSRVVDIPWRLMADLWDYLIVKRHQLLTTAKNNPRELFLNQYGEPYKPEGFGLNHALVALNLDFEVTAHVLRHTYATHTLYEMRKNKSSQDPLLYLKQRLGHASINSTLVYLHYLDHVEDDLMTCYQEEIDAGSMD